MEQEALMKKSFFVIACLFILAQTTHAQRYSFNSYRERISESKLVKTYSDSLYYYQAKLDSLIKADTTTDGRQLETKPSDARYYRLFAPLTFYHSPANKELRIDSGQDGQSPTDDEIDNALLHVYLNRPDLIRNSENNLRDIGGINNEINVPIQRNVELVEKVAPTTVEPANVPVNVLVKKPNFWTYKGDYYLQFLQNYISGNWYKGGESNYSMLGSVIMEANYNNKQKVKWDNKLELKLGFLTTKSDSIHSFKTSDDLIRYTGKLGLQATKRWYYTLQVLAYTQFYKGYKTNDPYVYSAFMSPFNLNISLGMDYSVEAFNKKLTGTIHLAPAAYNFRYVSRRNLASRYGIDEGKHTLHDIGSQFTIDLTWKFNDMFNWKTRLYGFTTYRRAELEWENTFTFKFNKYISTNIFIYPRFDDETTRDGHHGYWQLKEFMSIGFAYSF